ncbi:MAG: metal-dependent phosphohydrolase, partial [Actinomycetota bacterium]
ADVADRAHVAGADLLRRYGEPHRRYHDVRHLTEVLDGVDELAAHALDPDAVRLAAWFHDAVYDVRAPAGASEAASADLAASVLALLGHPGVDAVVRLVRLTATHDPAADDADGQVLCDADLRILAADDARYAEYARDVRAEYAHVPDADFAAGRAAVMGALLAHDRLYATATARERWEARGRANVAAELARLSVEDRSGQGGPDPSR